VRLHESGGLEPEEVRRKNSRSKTQLPGKFDWCAWDDETLADHCPVGFSAIARGAGFSARRVSTHSDVREVIGEALSSPDPELVELVTDPNALSIPPKITVGQAGSFALAEAR
jgi:hypothetical protein